MIKSTKIPSLIKLLKIQKYFSLDLNKNLKVWTR